MKLCSRASQIKAPTAALKKRRKQSGYLKKRRMGSFKVLRKMKKMSEAKHTSKEEDQQDEVMESTTGIHSPEWAFPTPSQKSPFLNLPLEIRLMIWELVITSFNNYLPIIPHRRQNHFQSPNWQDAATETNNIFGVCRQVYMDVVGGGLLYRFKHFCFAGPVLLTNYLAAIRPSHRDSLRHISLVLKPTRLKPRHHNATSLLALSRLPNLHSLTLILNYSPIGFTSPPAAGPYYVLANGNIAVAYQVTDEFLARVRDWKELRAINGLVYFRLRVFASGYGFVPIVDMFEDDGEVGRFTLVDGADSRLIDANPGDALRQNIEKIERELRGVMCSK